MDCSEILPCSISWKKADRPDEQDLTAPLCGSSSTKVSITVHHLNWLHVSSCPTLSFSSSLSTWGCTSQLKYWHLNPFFRLISQAPKLCCLTDLLQFLLVHSLILKFWPNLMLDSTWNQTRPCLFGESSNGPQYCQSIFLIYVFVAWTVSLSNYISLWFNHY